MQSEREPIKPEVVASEPEAGGQVVPFVPSDQAIGEFLGVTGSLSLDNFDGNEEQKWMLESVAVDGETIKSNKIVNGVIPVKYFYLHKVEIVDEKTGEVNQCTRTVLIDPDGVAYSFVSGGIAMCVIRMAKRFGRKPFDPARRMMVRSRPTKDGKSMLVLVPETLPQV